VERSVQYKQNLITIRFRTTLPVLIMGASNEASPHSNLKCNKPIAVLGTGTRDVATGTGLPELLCPQY
jgi:hypothetical protein